MDLELESPGRKVKVLLCGDSGVGKKYLVEKFTARKVDTIPTMGKIRRVS